MTNRFLRIAGKLWNAPNSGIGILLGEVGIGFGFLGRRSLGNNAIQYHGNRILSFAFMPIGLTIGNVILYAPGYEPDAPLPNGTLGPHELQHTFQGEVLGPLYLPAHILLQILARVINGHTHGHVNLLERGPQATPPRPGIGGRAAG